MIAFSAKPPAETVPPPQTETPATPSGEAPAATATEETRNILFSYHGAGKNVAIVGDFNNWFREPLRKKKDNVWRTSVKLRPGTYKYMFVVDDKRVRDPNNKSVSDGGRSVLTVKPAS